jgi:hypothetical protein
MKIKKTNRFNMAPNAMIFPITPVSIALLMVSSKLNVEKK